MPKVTLLNDLKANAYGLRHLGPTDLAILQTGAHDATGNQAILSAGTGLGCAGLYWDGQRHRPFATEGGHADFAPRNHLEAELMEDIAREKGRVSAERILSGSGLVRIYRFLRERSGVPEPPALAERFAKEDPAAVVSRSALERRGSGLRPGTGRCSSPPTGRRQGTSPSGCSPPAASSSGVASRRRISPHSSGMGSS